MPSNASCVGQNAAVLWSTNRALKCVKQSLTPARISMFITCLIMLVLARSSYLYRRPYCVPYMVYSCRKCVCVFQLLIRPLLLQKKFTFESRDECASMGTLFVQHKTLY